MILRYIKSVAVMLALASTTTAFGAEPSGYYSSCENKSGADLLSALCTKVGPHTTVSYNGLLNLYKTSDVYPDGKIWDMYSTKHWTPGTTCGNYSKVGDCYNREHSFPKSWFNDASPMYSEAFHIYPTDGKVNGQRSNYPYGECANGTTLASNGSVKALGKLGSCTFPGYSGTVFEPDDEYKGDFARSYFYMAAAYNDRIATWNSKMLAGNRYPAFSSWAINLLLKWHRQDPVSEKETRRNDAVYSVQNNRNPFIDHPELAEYIWGNKKGLPFDPGAVQPGGDPVLTTPVQDMTLDFGRVAIGKTATARLLFKGEYLTSAVRVQKYTGNADMFALAAAQIPAALINSEDGYWLNINYTPTETGEHTTRLLISGGGVSGSRGVALTARCLPVPTLGALHATDATDITNTQYVANWDAADEDIDYYIVTRTKYVNGNAVSEEIISEDNFLVITGFDESDSETYSVRSSMLGYESAPSNVIVVEHNGISDVTVAAPLGIAETPGGIRVICDKPLQGLVVYDIAGKVVTERAYVENNTEIMLPAGVYFVTADGNKRPVKVAVR